MATYAQTYPTVVAAITEYFQDDHTVDDLFHGFLNVIIEGATTMAGVPGWRVAPVACPKWMPPST